MNLGPHLPTSYRQARDAFTSAARDAGAQLISHTNPVNTGPEGEDLITDVACLGPQGRGPALLICSGTHGIEGYCGSAIQTGLLNDGIFDPVQDVLSVYLVHAINPHGFAYNRRVNEDNVDLNRNFINFSQPLPNNENYDELHDALVPPMWDAAHRAEAERKISAYIGSHGMTKYQAAVTTGQWSHPDGLFFGGQTPCWSNKTWQRILQDHLKDHNQIAAIDIHTGLGPFGYGELICIDRLTSPECKRARSWYGEGVTSTDDGSSTSAPVQGALLPTLDTTFPQAEITSIALEFGTRPIDVVLSALRADNWLHTQAEHDSPLKISIVDDMRSAFYPQEEAWKSLVWIRAHEIVTKAISSLQQ